MSNCSERKSMTNTRKARHYEIMGLLRFELRSPAPEADMLTKLHYNPLNFFCQQIKSLRTYK